MSQVGVTCRAFLQNSLLSYVASAFSYCLFLEARLHVIVAYVFLTAASYENVGMANFAFWVGWAW